MIYYDQRKRRWMNGGRKATNAEVRSAREIALKDGGGSVLCWLDDWNAVQVGPGVFFKLTNDGRAVGIARTRYGA